jgi:hypothetical protein
MVKESASRARPTLAPGDAADIQATHSLTGAFASSQRVADDDAD